MVMSEMCMYPQLKVRNAHIVVLVLFILQDFLSAPVCISLCLKTSLGK